MSRKLNKAKMVVNSAKKGKNDWLRWQPRSTITAARSWAWRGVARFFFFFAVEKFNFFLSRVFFFLPAI